MSKFQVLNDPKVETVLAQLYQKADRQSKSLLFHYLLPQIPNLLMRKGIKNWAVGYLLLAVSC
ncbi:MAG: hypothetical protein QNJ54_26045 [Prochloraceae cyanobacterium]|nr:hypothetical protein [Prochloraceae cyanobacterium]